MQSAITTSNLKVDAFEVESTEAHANRKDVTVTSEVEGRLVQGMAVIEEHTAKVRAAWKKKEQEQGEPFYTCPICPPEARTKFTTKKACASHIRSAHQAKVEELKLTRAAKDAYEPMKRIKSPKRTIEDYMTPEKAHLARAARQATEQLNASLAATQRGSSAELTASRVFGMVESLAVGQVAKLDDVELKKLAQLAWSRGRRNLTKACRVECRKRNIPLLF